MKIMITCPSVSVPHGGIRVILEWANRLTRWHDVFLYNEKQECNECSWFKISEKVNSVQLWQLAHMDVLIISSPHSMYLADFKMCPKKVFIFMQMAEHMFRPEDKSWQQLCHMFYTSRHPLISISQWNIEMVVGEYGRSGDVYHVGNGVNLDDFPIENQKKDGKTILVEGIYTTNPSKDRDGIAYTVCCKLIKEGYSVLSYSQNKSHFGNMTWYNGMPTEFYHRPSLEKLNELYNRATILIKATRYDARACAPMEALTKGTVTARAMIKGDDDLVDGYNCLRSPYNAHYLYQIAKSLLTDQTLREQLAMNGYQHLIENSWDIWMDRINSILTS